MSVLQNSETDNTQPNPSLDLTEEEATRYDRQMRLWGIEAQQRMRNATILVLNLRGVTTEAIKNMVLAGIGKLIIVDGENVSEEDLGAGFFFRDGDVGLNRLDVAKSRIESLNPLVTVEIVTDKAFAEGERLESLVKDVDLVRKSNSNLTRDRSAPKEQPRSVKATTVYTPLSSAIGYRWSGLSKRQTKEAVHGHLPTEINQTEELEALANKFISEADVNKQILPTEPRSVIE
uniref:THIF-type NAD/FAD binding fold domain-containing protein n=1 Tax=Psilocybe cubensis TaxID=181762 RepID=A0A8H7XT80_PSICU